MNLCDGILRAPYLIVSTSLHENGYWLSWHLAQQMHGRTIDELYGKLIEVFRISDILRDEARHETVDREFSPSNADDAISTSVSLQAPCNVFVKMVSLDSKREDQLCR